MTEFQHDDLFGRRDLRLRRQDASTPRNLTSGRSPEIETGAGGSPWKLKPDFRNPALSSVRASPRISHFNFGQTRTDHSPLFNPIRPLLYRACQLHFVCQPQDRVRGECPPAAVHPARDGGDSQDAGKGHGRS